MGILGEPGCLRNDRRMRAGTYPPPPMAIMRFGWKSLRMRGAASWHNLWTCWAMSVLPNLEEQLIYLSYLIVGHVFLYNHFEDDAAFECSTAVCKMWQIQKRPLMVRNWLGTKFKWRKITKEKANGIRLLLTWHPQTTNQFILAMVYWIIGVGYQITPLSFLRGVQPCHPHTVHFNIQ